MNGFLHLVKNGVEAFFVILLFLIAIGAVLVARNPWGVTGDTRRAEEQDHKEAHKKP
jgi:hypothetical protein